MFDIIDDFLNRITMYRLVLFYLIFLLGIAAILGQFKLLPFSPLALLFSTGVLLLLSWGSNKLFAAFLQVQTNVESVYITALILALIISPPASGAYIAALPFLFWAALLAQASKYVLNISHKHIFNPAALAVAITALALSRSANWWVGTSSMLIFVVLGGLLVIRKVQRFDAAVAFVAAAAVAAFALSPVNPWVTVYKLALFSPVFFFAAIMLTEPLTMPPTLDGRLSYGILVGLLFAPYTHIGGLYFTPELALLAGNIFSYIISPKGRQVLRLKEKRPAGSDIYDFVFEPERGFKFQAGQYMEWTLGHPNTDNRGNRRYFTLASSPTEKQVLLGVKFYDNSSSYKRRLLAMQPGETILAGQLAGDFTLPDDPKQKLAFIAGGIGITPFRSMLKYLADRGDRRSVVLFYSNRRAGEAVYQDVLTEAGKKIDLKVVQTITDQAPSDWQGYRGYFTSRLIMRELPDFAERTFYVSGSHTMVEAFKKNLAELGVSRTKIKTDFFPGLA